MDDSWDWVQDELKKMQDEMPQDPEMMQVVDAISVADFWKRRYDEERMLWERKLEIKEDEKKNLKDKAQSHEMSIKELDYRFKELERRWEQEKLMLEDRLKSKEIESSLEKAQLMWETRLKLLEEENRTMKSQLGLSPDVPAQVQGGTSYTVATPAADAARREMEKHLSEREAMLKKSEEEAKKRLEALEAEKNEVARTMAEKERSLSGAFKFQAQAMALRFGLSGVAGRTVGSCDFRTGGANSRFDLLHDGTFPCWLIWGVFERIANGGA